MFTVTMKDAIRMVDGYSGERLREALRDSDPMIRAAASWKARPYDYGEWAGYLRYADICPQCHLPACICGKP